MRSSHNESVTDSRSRSAGINEVSPAGRLSAAPHPTAKSARKVSASHFAAPFQSTLRAHDVPLPAPTAPVVRVPADHGYSAGEQRSELRFANRAELPPLERALGFTIANSMSRLSEAFSLVGRSYVAAGLEPDSRGDLRVFPHHALATTQVFSAIHRPEFESPNPRRDGPHSAGDTIATVSMVLDGAMGLAMEHTAPGQLERMRAEGKVLAEMNSLAMVPEHRNSSLIMRLHRFAVEYARLKGVTHLVMSAIYKHASMYQRCFGFEPIGPAVRYWDGAGVLVQPMAISLEQARRANARFNRNRPIDGDLEAFFFDSTGSREAAESGSWSREYINYFFGERQAEVADWAGSERLGAWSGELEAVSGGTTH